MSQAAAYPDPLSILHGDTALPGVTPVLELDMDPGSDHPPGSCPVHSCGTLAQVQQHGASV